MLDSEAQRAIVVQGRSTRSHDILGVSAPGDVQSAVGRETQCEDAAMPHRRDGAEAAVIRTSPEPKYLLVSVLAR